MTALVEIFEKCSVQERALAQQAIFIGLAMNEYVHQFKRGDFVIRNLIGVDQQNGALYVSDLVQVGETIQFHVRDKQSADEDLHVMLQDMKAKLQKRKPAGALIFCCNGRGERLFSIKDHDTGAIQKSIGPFPQGGFFCAGEIGPVGGKNFIHGFTSSVALFFPRD
jgi:small ligand-binding sensory domain FIST